jgi:hypothetical protein
MPSVPCDRWWNRAGTPARTSQCAPPAVGSAAARYGVTARTARSRSPARRAPSAMPALPPSNSNWSAHRCPSNRERTRSSALTAARAARPAPRMSPASRSANARPARPKYNEDSDTDAPSPAASRAPSRSAANRPDLPAPCGAASHDSNNGPGRTRIACFLVPAAQAPGTGASIPGRALDRLARVDAALDDLHAVRGPRRRTASCPSAGHQRWRRHDWRRPGSRRDRRPPSLTRGLSPGTGA